MYENQIKIFNFKNDLKIIISSFFFEQISSIGGCRHMPYSSIHDAINDCFDLSYAMALKAYFLEIAYGGSKCVIYNPNQLPFEKIAPFLGESINQLEGRYIASIDIGVGCKEIDLLSKHTPFVYGTKKHQDPSLYTGQGVIETLNLIFTQLKKPTNEITVSIQGLGKVGTIVADFCLDKGVYVNGSDINLQRLEAYSSHPNFNKVDVDQIITSNCDILIPSASGNVINSSNIDDLNTKYICPVANNPVENPNFLSEKLTQRGIIFLPDFITNAGGLLCVANELEIENTKKKSINCISNKIDQLLKKFHKQNLYNEAIQLFNQGQQID